MSTQPVTSLADIIEPFGGLTPDAAAQVAALEVPEKVQARAQELAIKSNEGTLTAAEKAEYETLVKYGSMFSVIKARARKVASNVSGGR